MFIWLVLSYSLESSQYAYEFNAELCALEIADRRDREICEEAEKVRQRMLMQEQQQQQQQQQQKQQKEREEKQRQQNHETEVREPAVQQPESVGAEQMTHTLTTRAPVPVPLTDSRPVVTSQPVMMQTNSVPVVVPVASSSHYSTTQVTTTPAVTRFKPINTKDFDPVAGSSPFDDALLKSIDEKQELNSVFANAYHNNNSSSSSTSSSASNHLNHNMTSGASHSHPSIPANHFHNTNQSFFPNSSPST